MLRCGDVVLDTARRRACRAGRPLDLAPKEFGVLELLLAAGGRTVSAEELLERVWDENANPFTAAVKITVSRLRAKLGEPPLIDTVPRSGYRIGGSESHGDAAHLASASGAAPDCAGSGSRSGTARLFLASGAALLAITYGLVGSRPSIGQTGRQRRVPGAGRRLPPHRPQQASPGHGAARPQLHALLTRSGLALAIMTVLSVALGWLVAGRALSPLRTITAAARQISATSLSRAPGPRRPGR